MTIVAVDCGTAKKAKSIAATSRRHGMRAFQRGPAVYVDFEASMGAIEAAFRKGIDAGEIDPACSIVAISDMLPALTPEAT